MADRFGVAGSPILFSRSPELFSHFCAQLSLGASYTRVSAPTAWDALALARAAGLTGLNLTSPFKAAAYPLCTALGEEARALGVVNTVLLRKEEILGYNTDLMGVLRLLEGIPSAAVQGAALVLGAGGAAHAAVLGLQQSGCQEITVLNRTPKRARALAQRWGISYGGLEALPRLLPDHRLLLSTLPKEAQEGITLPVGKQHIVLDAAYGSPPWSRAVPQSGACYRGGLHWLVGQAIQAYKRFTGVEIAPERLEEGLDLTTPPLERMAIIGMPGVGKSTVGRMFSQSRLLFWRRRSG